MEAQSENVIKLKWMCVLCNGQQFGIKQSENIVRITDMLVTFTEAKNTLEEEGMNLSLLPQYGLNRTVDWNPQLCFKGNLRGQL